MSADLMSLLTSPALVSGANLPVNGCTGRRFEVLTTYAVLSTALITIATSSLPVYLIKV